MGDTLLFAAMLALCLPNMSSFEPQRNLMLNVTLRRAKDLTPRE
ncbi:MAG: hypothetical protein N3B10_14185 [Armatimonadetes bacterium]|nr:hypothetical protein [Armatimonadota bacterium]MCX7969619.1 hypothetical protein [Armatimonadota bacterium]MDW8144134.1 hypothetical protein [Armatimonadota bacterium]